MDQRLIRVDVSVGFLPSFCPAFLQHYQRHRAFILAAADLLTLALAEAHDRAGQPHGDVARVADDAHVAQLKRLVEAVPNSRKPLIEEAIGLVGVGGLKICVDAALGAGSFERWIDALQAGDLGGCAGLLDSPFGPAG